MMKKLFLALCVCAGLCACSSDDDLVGSTSTGNSAEGVAFLRVNLKDVGSSTRATSDGFAYGTADEQKVNNAYFYLYKSDGSYYAYGSAGEITGTASGDPGTIIPDDNDNSGNIEWNSGTQVAIYGLTDPSVPTQMLTVINQPSGLSLQNKTLSQAVATLAGTPWGEAGNILMSTSTYSSNGVVNTTALEESDFALEPINLDTDYPDGGVDVYVERLAAKVGVNVSDQMTSLTTNGYIYAASTEELANFPMGAPEPRNSSTGGIAIQLLGFDVDGIARDAYVSKHINTSWNFTGFTWNSADAFRSYWAESPNYDVETTYPTSAYNATTQKYNDAEAEDNSSTWLNDYLRYVDLKSPVAIGGTTYCGENTNTVVTTTSEGTTGVIDAADNNGLTNVIVKAQFGDYNPNDTSTPFAPIDIVEFHKEYYTAEQFCQKTVDDVVDYDFTVVVDEVIAALETTYPAFSSYIEQLKDAIILDHIYKSDAVYDGNTQTYTHKFGTGVDGPESVSAFGGEMLSLYNVGDGNVDIFYNGAQPYWGDGSETNPFTPVGSEIIAKYPASDIVYPAENPADLDKYDFWFHVDGTKFGDLIDGILEGIGIMYEIDGAYYMPIDNSISFTTQATGDDSYSGGHLYTTRNFLLRTITVEADGIDTEFGSIYPNYYKDGLMYYHVPIEHLNTTTGDDIVEGEYGVVRNHWYDVTITSLNGLGRGIAVEDEVIVPQKEIPYYYLGADINILSWHHVTQGADLK